jgi:hypothetical protein
MASETLAVQSVPSYQRYMLYSWYDILGTLGVAVIILAYVLLQIGRLRSAACVFTTKCRWCFVDPRFAVLQL